VPEWSIGTVSKTVVPSRVPWVRIPPSPPKSHPMLSGMHFKTGQLPRFLRHHRPLLSACIRTKPRSMCIRMRIHHSAPVACQSHPQGVSRHARIGVERAIGSVPLDPIAVSSARCARPNVLTHFVISQPPRPLLFSTLMQKRGNNGNTGNVTKRRNYIRCLRAILRSQNPDFLFPCSQNHHQPKRISGHA